MRYRLLTAGTTFVVLLSIVLISCNERSGSGDRQEPESTSDLLIKRRDDGTISSVNQVDDMGIVHGLRVTYFEDGETAYSKTSFNHGIKEGPAERYYRNGQVFEHTSYVNGKRHGLTRKYYMNGDLAAEFRSENGYVQPGLKEYNRDGSAVTSYPGIGFMEVDQLASRSRVELQVYCEKKGLNVKYYRREMEDSGESRVYLISEGGQASLQFYVRPGESLHERIEIIAEIPTALGNIMVRNLTYQLNVSNN